MTHQAPQPHSLPGRKFDAVVIGASAGAVEALMEILPALPASFPLPIMIVVHVPPDHDSILADLFAERCGLTVKEAEDKEILRGGSVYFAPPNYHLLTETDGRVSLSSDEPVLFSRPSINILFETAADAYGDRLIGIILTGANSDGSRGLRAICDAGGLAIVQRPEQAYMVTMPEAALRACPSAWPMSLVEIVEFLKHQTMGNESIQPL